MKTQKSRLEIHADFKRIHPPKGACLIYDRKLKKIDGFSVWSKKFVQSLSVDAGESLKSIDSFERIASVLLRWKSKNLGEFQIWSAGGGSVGDFSGFTASVLQRGVPWVHIPTTWLSAIDSAHGGKTALNLGAKNQIGSFYWPKEILLVREVLLAQTQKLLEEAWAEAIKVSLLSSSKLVTDTLKAEDSKAYWKLLPKWIQAKNKIVALDPFEKNGIRATLNLGHTLGHVLEKIHKISHGEAVLNGLKFALEWSYHQGYLSQQEIHRFRGCPRMPAAQSYSKVLQRTLDRKDLMIELLRLDKKNHLKGLRFIYLKKIGKPVVKYITKEGLCLEVQRQADFFCSKS